MYIPSFYKNENKEEIRRFVQQYSFGVLMLRNTRETPDVRDATGDEVKEGPIAVVKDAYGKPVVRKTLARHLPFELDLDSNHYNDGNSFETLTAHLGMHYPIYSCFEDLDDALVIFHGPQSYVSPSWYDNLEGATWDYMAVHVYGKVERLDTEESIERMKKGLIDKYGADSHSRVFKEEMKMAEDLLAKIQEGDKPQLRKLIKTQLYKYEKKLGNENLLSLELLGGRYDYLSKYLGVIRIHVESFESNVQAAYKLSQDQTDWSRANTIRHLRNSGIPDSIAIADEMEKRNGNVSRGEV